MEMMRTIPQTVEDDSVDLKPGQLPRLSLSDIAKVSTGTDPKILKKKRKSGENTSNAREPSHSKKQTGEVYVLYCNSFALSSCVCTLATCSYPKLIVLLYSVIKICFTCI